MLLECYIYTYPFWDSAFYRSFSPLCGAILYGNKIITGLYTGCSNSKTLTCSHYCQPNFDFFSSGLWLSPCIIRLQQYPALRRQKSKCVLKGEVTVRNHGDSGTTIHPNDITFLTDDIYKVTSTAGQLPMD